MTVLFISSWVVKPEKQMEYSRLVQRLFEYMKKNPKAFKELKSLKFYTQTFGGIVGSSVELAEYESLADYETFQARMKKDKEHMKMYQEFMLL
jgi:hypothetical protein